MKKALIYANILILGFLSNVPLTVATYMDNYKMANVITQLNE